MNVVAITGEAQSDVQLAKTGRGDDAATMHLRIRSGKFPDGRVRPVATVRVNFFNNNALAVKHIRKGDVVFVRGELHSRITRGDRNFILEVRGYVANVIGHTGGDAHD